MKSMLFVVFATRHEAVGMSLILQILKQHRLDELCFAGNRQAWKNHLPEEGRVDFLQILDNTFIDILQAFRYTVLGDGRLCQILIQVFSKLARYSAGRLISGPRRDHANEAFGVVSRAVTRQATKYPGYFSLPCSPQPKHP